MSRLEDEPVRPARAVIGLQWGDEGKGKIVDLLAKEAEIVMRVQGGSNAGHTVCNKQGEFKLHLVPSGICYPKVLNIIGANVVFKPEALISEIKQLRSCGVSVNNLRISPKASLTLDYHLLLERMEEEARGDNIIGTTYKGIGPTYEGRAERADIRAGLLATPDILKEELADILDRKRKILKLSKEQQAVFQIDHYIPSIDKASEMLAPMVVDTEEIVQQHLQRAYYRHIGNAILIEGAQGVLLDKDHGTYPMVTSSNPTVAGLLQGAGIAPRYLGQTIAIVKAYQTRVGKGAMPTELLDYSGDFLREKGQEYGTTTGRPRRVGSLDGVALRYAQEINGVTDVCLTKLDILSGMGPLRICTSYELDGETIDRFPPDNRTLSRCKPNYQEYEGWSKDIRGINKFKDLPLAAQKYCLTVMENIPGARLSYVGVGPGREDIIVL